MSNTERRLQLWERDPATVDWKGEARVMIAAARVIVASNKLHGKPTEQRIIDLANREKPY